VIWHDVTILATLCIKGLRSPNLHRGPICVTSSSSSSTSSQHSLFVTCHPCLPTNIFVTHNWSFLSTRFSAINSRCVDVSPVSIFDSPIRLPITRSPCVDSPFTIRYSTPLSLQADCYLFHNLSHHRRSSVFKTVCADSWPRTLSSDQLDFLFLAVFSTFSVSLLFSFVRYIKLANQASFWEHVYLSYTGADLGFYKGGCIISKWWFLCIPGYWCCNCKPLQENINPRIEVAKNQQLYFRKFYAYCCKSMEW